MGGEEKIDPFLKGVKNPFKNQIKQKNHKTDVMEILLRFHSISEPKLGDSWLSCLSPALQLLAPVTQLMDNSSRDQEPWESMSYQRQPRDHSSGCYTRADELLGSASVALSRKAVRMAAQDASSGSLL